MASATPARVLAFKALVQAHEQQRYIREVVSEQLNRKQTLDSRDAALALKLAVGVTATQGCLDELLNTLLDKPNKVSLRVRMALRIATYEMLYMDHSAEVAVSQGVELVRLCAKSATGLANAVLRRVGEQAADYLNSCDVSEGARYRVAQARRAGLPVWLIDLIADSLGEPATEELCTAQLQPAPIAIHVNPLRESELDLHLSHDNSLPLPGSFEVSDIASLEQQNSFDEARVVASDLYAQIIACAATRSGSCLEIGAGRGTKTFVMHSAAHRTEMTREHISSDISAGKCRSNKARIAQAGFVELITCAGDACDLGAVLSPIQKDNTKELLFDTVFVDAPCSGTGTMRRHPEIPWRLSKVDVESKLPDLQFKMLSQAAAQVKPGGELFYATCSVLRSENHEVVMRFLSSEVGSEFQVVPVSEAEIFKHECYKTASALLKECEDDMGLFQSSPRIGAYDGHFCARLIRS